MGRGVKAAGVQTPRRPCSAPLSAPHGRARPGLPWGPYLPRASKQRQPTMTHRRHRLNRQTHNRQTHRRQWHAGRRQEPAASPRPHEDGPSRGGARWRHRGQQGLRFRGSGRGTRQPVAQATRMTRGRHPGSSEAAPSTRVTPPGGFTPQHQATRKILLLSSTHFLGVLASAFPGEVNSGPDRRPHRTLPESHRPTSADSAEPHVPAHTAAALPQHTGLGNWTDGCKGGRRGTLASRH